jgi:hypothetical protein
MWYHLVWGSLLVCEKRKLFHQTRLNTYLLPPGQWDPQIRIEPPEKVPSQVTKSTNVYSHIITLSRSLNLEIYQPLVNLLILYIYIYIYIYWYVLFYLFDRFIIVCMCIFTLSLYSRKSKIKYSGIELVSNVFAHLFTHFFPHYAWNRWVSRPSNSTPPRTMGSTNSNWTTRESSITGN